MLGGLARTGRAARGRRIGRRRWHLWSVLSVAALSIFVLVAIFQMANLYVEGLGLTGPGIASPTADTAPAAAGADDAQQSGENAMFSMDMGGGMPGGDMPGGGGMPSGGPGGM